MTLQDFEKEKMDEFDTFFKEHAMILGHEPSPKGTQRVWATAYPLREMIKSFISSSLRQSYELGMKEKVKRSRSNAIILESSLK